MDPVSTGIGLGLYAGNVVVKYSRQDYEHKISVLDKAFGALSGHLNTLIGYRNEISQFWNDNNATSYTEAINRQIEQVRTAMYKVGELKGFFTSTMQGLEQSNALVSKGVHAINNIVNSLTE